MPAYFFIYKCGSETAIDRDGEEFPDDHAAHAHAIAVARELMCNRKDDYRSSRLEVRDESLKLCFEVLFASVDETLEHLPAPLKRRIERGAHLRAMLQDTIEESKSVVAESRELLTAAAAWPPVGQKNGDVNQR